jgi:glycine cleavage system aminomethyltransferase T
MLGIGIGLGYLPAALGAPGSALTIDVRGRRRLGEVTSKPIYRPVRHANEQANAKE